MRFWFAAMFGLTLGLRVARAQPPAGTPAQSSTGTVGPDLYEAGKELFDQLAPPEIKQQYEFPSRQQFEDFLSRLQGALDGDSIEDLGQYEAQGRAILQVLRTDSQLADYAGWLQARLEEIDEAREIVAAERAVGAGAAGSRGLPSPGGRRPPQSGRLGETSLPPEDVPYYDAWLRRVKDRPVPAAAAGLMPELRAEFSKEGIPPELAWLAEVESSFNPSARSPAGAKGLFQLKADTARELGLSTFLPDERTNPEKSARAAAEDLRRLREKFGSWPLALAAYNAGEGRVGRALRATDSSNFAGIAAKLPAETRMYVPEVLAVVATRTGKVLK